MTTQRRLLTIAAALECLAGLALLLAPRITTALLLGVEPTIYAATGCFVVRRLTQ